LIGREDASLRAFREFESYQFRSRKHSGVYPDTDLAGAKEQLLVRVQADPGLRMERLPGASHWVMHEESQRLNQLIREFIGA